MIAIGEYTCSEGSSPGEAVLVCVEPGCSAYALRCCRKACSCKNAHLGHQLMDFDILLKDVDRPLTLPAPQALLEKRIEDTIEGLIRDLEVLRAKHREHVKEHLQRVYGGSTLRRQLAERRPLERETSTGNNFSSLLK